MKKLWAWAVRFLLKRCEHPPQHVTADILEGDMSPHWVKWCRLCGAYRRSLEWTVPRPDWWL